MGDEKARAGKQCVVVQRCPRESLHSSEAFWCLPCMLLTYDHTAETRLLDGVLFACSV